MKKITLCLMVLLTATISSFAQSEAPDFNKIAIVPFHLLGYPQADNVAAVQDNIDEAFEALQIPAEVMSAEETAALFSSKGINKDNIHTTTVEDLAGMIGVDALIFGEVNSPSNGQANMNEIVLQLVDGSNGQIVWRAAKDIAMTESGADVKSVMTASTDKFPVGNND